MAGSGGEGILCGAFYGVTGEGAFVFSSSLIGGGSEFDFVALNGTCQRTDAEAAMIGAGEFVALLVEFKGGISAAERELDVRGKTGDSLQEKDA